MELSKEMQRAVNWAKANGGKIHRHPGGFWGSEDFIKMDAKWFSTPTVRALTTRGAAEYTRWIDGSAGKFPVEITLLS